jgi:hypothetical protein
LRKTFVLGEESDESCTQPKKIKPCWVYLGFSSHFPRDLKASHQKFQPCVSCFSNNFMVYVFFLFMAFRAIKQDQKIPFIPAANKIRMLKMTEHDPMMLQVFRQCLFSV